MTTASAERQPPLPDGLIAKLRADPMRAPEIIALAAADVHAPAAVAYLAEQRASGLDGRDLALKIKKRHAQYARFGGAATGFGGAVTIVPDLAGLAWIQSRMVFFMAGAYGFDPADPMRPAELLVLQEIYDDPVEARKALDDEGGRSVAQAYVDGKMSGESKLTRTLAKFVGKRALKRIIGKSIPGVAVAVNAIGNERDTRDLADRCIRFYGG